MGDLPLRGSCSGSRKSGGMSVAPSSARNRISLSYGLAAALLTGFVALALPGAHARAASGVLVDFGPELAAVGIGQPVALTVTAQDDLGALQSGLAVRVYFVSGPNDPGLPGNKPDLTCTTDATGACIVGYTPLAIGTDVLCAVISGGPFQCDELATAPELDDNEDVIAVIVTLEGPISSPTAAPTAEPTTAPTAEPTAEPTVAPTAEPTVAPTPESTVAPTPEPTAEPTAEPTTAPTAEPTVAPTPEPTAAPTPDTPAESPPSPASPAPPAPASTGSIEPAPAGSDGGPGNDTGAGSARTVDEPHEGFFQAVLAIVSEYAETVVQPVVTALAPTLPFPLALVIVVSLFLLFRRRRDQRDASITDRSTTA